GGEPCAPTRVKSKRRAHEVSGQGRGRRPRRFGWPLQTTLIFARFRATDCSFRIATALGEASEASRWPYRSVVCIDECPSSTRTSFRVIPAFSIFVAKVWRSVWTVYGTPAACIVWFRYVVLSVRLEVRFQFVNTHCS